MFTKEEIKQINADVKQYNKEIGSKSGHTFRTAYWRKKDGGETCLGFHPAVLASDLGMKRMETQDETTK